MAVIAPCSAAGGRLVPIRTRGLVQPLTLAVQYEGQPIRLADIGVVTRVQMGMQVATQFQNALSDVIYITPFGDAPGQIAITFVANRLCQENIPSFDVIQAYLENRILPGTATAPGQRIRPLTVSVGSAAFRAYNVGLAFDAESSGVQMLKGTLQFTAWPE